MFKGLIIYLGVNFFYDCCNSISLFEYVCCF